MQIPDSITLVSASEPDALLLRRAQACEVGLADLVAAVAETLPGVAGDVWFAFGMRSGTPPAIINLLNAEVNRINKTPEMTERINKLGAIQLFNTPEEFGAFMKAEFEKWGSLLKQVPIKLD